MTRDKRLIIKEVHKIEYDSFLEFGQSYFNHLDGGGRSCLAKILGVYKVCKGQEESRRLIVMENIAYGHDNSKVYDLKGLTYKRLALEGTSLDENFMSDKAEKQFCISQQAKKQLVEVISHDTTFLRDINVMDYLLLVVMDSEKEEIIYGIIDWLREYTWDKRLESLYKSWFVAPRNVKPTVISPGSYSKRFLDFFVKNIESLPNAFEGTSD